VDVNAGPARVDLPAPTVGPLSRLAPQPMKLVLNWGRRYSLWVFNFGLACCAIEFIASSMSRHDFIRLGVIPFAPGPRQADLMVVSGTVTDKMAPAVRRLYEQMPEPEVRHLLRRLLQLRRALLGLLLRHQGRRPDRARRRLRPRLPARPEALLQGIIKLQDKIARESLDDRYAERRRSGRTSGRPQARWSGARSSPRRAGRDDRCGQRSPACSATTPTVAESFGVVTADVPAQRWLGA
jgi:NADH-quinone oxidoreductase subunit B